MKNVKCLKVKRHKGFGFGGGRSKLSPILKKLNVFPLYGNTAKVVTRKKVAFTLAEILIALGIIGVIAAITISSIISYYKHKVLETQFKLAHSLLQNALVAIREEKPNLYNELQAYRNNIGATNLMKPLLIKNLETVKDYGRNGLYPYFNYGYRNYYNSGSSIGGWGDYGQFMLKNGMLVYTECSGGCAYIHVFVDTNGLKKPNRNGHDFFDFQLNSKNQLVPATQWGSDCNRRDAAAGLDCTFQALNDKNYFKKLPR